MCSQGYRAEEECSSCDSYRMIHDIYGLIDDGDRRVLRSFGLSTSHYAVLLQLDADQGCRLTELSERLLFDKSTITRIVDRLERAKLVRRIADPDDRRALRVVLTPAGVEQLALTRAAHQHSIERRLRHLDESERQKLLQLLKKLRAGLSADLEREAQVADSRAQVDKP